MVHVPGRPLTFLLTGFAWLVVSSLAGMAILIGLVLGTPLPSWFRLAHTHAALVGGVMQLIVGGFLIFIPTLLMTGHQRRESHPVLFLTVNLGALGMVAGFGLNQFAVVGTSGLLVAAAMLWVARDAWTQTRTSLNSPPLNVWFYALALLALFAGLAAGATMAFRQVQESYGYVRLAHIHLNVLGFITLAIVGTMHNLLPTLLNTPLRSPAQAKLVLWLLPLGLALLIGGFFTASIPLQMAAGGLLVITAGLYGTNLFRTWLASKQAGNAASDHLLIGTFFLLLTLVLGLLVSANNLGEQPLMPFGTLHLVAYTHLAFVGFILQTILGALSHLLPVTLAVRRVASNKKRGAYQDRLTQTINRWRTIQIGGLSLGTMGLALLASLTWNVPLSSPAIAITLWVSIGLIFSSLALFAVKLAAMLWANPDTDHTPSA